MLIIKEMMTMMKAKKLVSQLKGRRKLFKRKDLKEKNENIISIINVSKDTIKKNI
jgi:uncharacterized protein with WD repeat